MSSTSDLFEQTIAKSVNSITGMKAIRPSADTALSDVAIVKFKQKDLTKRVWIEVKMNHTDNLSNPRVFYKNGKWQTTYKTPAAKVAVDILNASPETKKFIKDIAKFSGIPEKVIQIPTTKSGLNEPGAVPLMVMKKYFDQPKVNRYIAHESNFNIGKLVTEHYTIGKKEPAHYMQAGDDFYLISKANPLKLSTKIPVLAGTGEFKVRVATRSEFYEVQAEIKIKQLNPPTSPYSVKPGTKKLNPFIT
jgi:hypothetical protein